MTADGVEIPMDQLLAHDGFVRGLAIGLMPDALGAEDLVQDTYLAALRRPPRRSERVREWLAVVVRNFAHQVRRSESRRARRELATARSAPIATPDEILDRETARRLLVDAVATLPDDYRNVILLRYFEDLTPGQIARYLEIPAETVRTRLKRARDRLRRQLAPATGSGWQVALLPLIPERALAVAGPASTTALSSALAAGVIMSKKTLLFGLLLGVSLGLGFVLGRSGPSGATAPDPPISGPEGAASRVIDSRGDDSTELARLRRELARLSAEKETLVADLDRVRSRVAQAGETGEGEPSPELGSPEGIDWDVLGALILGNREIFEQLAALRVERDGQWPPVNMKWLWKSHLTDLSEEERSRLRQFMMEWTHAAALARAETPYPFFLDEDVLPNLLLTLLGGPLELTEDQLSRLIGDSTELLERTGVHEDSTPLEAFLARGQVVDGVRDFLRDGLDPGQRESWKELDDLFVQFLQGDYTTAQVGLGSEDKGHRWLVRELKEEYGLESAPPDALARVARNYAASARAILERYRQWGDHPRPLDAAGRDALTREFRELQLRQERDFLDLLSPEERARLHERPPKIFTFDASHGFRGNSEVVGGF